MIVNSFTYLLFFAVVIVAYWSVSRTQVQNLILLGASLIFYAAWDWRFLGLLLFSITVDYVAARSMAKTVGRRRKGWLILSLVVNLGVLGFFKYFNFFLASTVDLLNSLNIPVSPTPLEILLPLGISFYTLKALSYTIEVYRGNLSPTQSWVNYALFVSFFPQLSAGPIERASRMLPAIETPRRLSGEQFETGLALILIGLVKKLVIADVAASLVDPTVFTSPLFHSGGDVLIAMYLFAVQLYADFSGYSDIARGTARLLGFETTENFNQPYLSPNIGDFWRRWHISLSFWLRDYIFLPFSRALLRRSERRHGQVIMVISNLLTMTVSGLWHGANWTFIVWGALHGVYLSIHRLLVYFKLLPVKFRSRVIERAWYGLSILVTFHLVLLGWVLFVAPSLEAARAILEQIGKAIFAGDMGGLPALLPAAVLLYMAIGCIDLAQVATHEHAFTFKLPSFVRTGLYTLGILAIIFFSVKPYVPFIYFQF
jgi:alginate O-acetyltransferase complex protein AlgI